MLRDDEQGHVSNEDRGKEVDSSTAGQRVDFPPYDRSSSLQHVSPSYTPSQSNTSQGEFDRRHCETNTKQVLKMVLDYTDRPTTCPRQPTPSQLNDQHDVGFRPPSHHGRSQTHVKYQRRKVCSKPYETRRSMNRKRAKGMPSRPLTAYNFYFRDQRAQIVAERDANKRKVGESPDNDDENPAREPGKPSRPKFVCPSHFFENLAKQIGGQWRKLPEEDRAKYIEMAKRDKQRYRDDLEALHQKKMKKAIDRAIGGLLARSRESVNQVPLSNCELIHTKDAQEQLKRLPVATHTPKFILCSKDSNDSFWSVTRNDPAEQESAGPQIMRNIDSSYFVTDLSDANKCGTWLPSAQSSFLTSAIRNEYHEDSLTTQQKLWNDLSPEPQHEMPLSARLSQQTDVYQGDACDSLQTLRPLHSDDDNLGLSTLSSAHRGCISTEAQRESTDFARIPATSEFTAGAWPESQEDSIAIGLLSAHLQSAEFGYDNNMKVQSILSRSGTRDGNLLQDSKMSGVLEKWSLNSASTSETNLVRAAVLSWQERRNNSECNFPRSELLSSTASSNAYFGSQAEEDRFGRNEKTRSNVEFATTLKDIALHAMLKELSTMHRPDLQTTQTYSTAGSDVLQRCDPCFSATIENTSTALQNDLLERRHQRMLVHNILRDELQTLPPRTLFNANHDASGSRRHQLELLSSSSTGSHELVSTTLPPTNRTLEEAVVEKYCEHLLLRERLERIREQLDKE